jgi:nicotinamide riboside transporter PnuC
MGVGLFWLQGLKATAGLYLLFALLAMVGLRQWQRQLAINKASS